MRETTLAEALTVVQETVRQVSAMALALCTRPLRSCQMAAAGLCRCLVSVTHIPLKQKLLYCFLKGVSAEGRITKEGAKT